MFSFLREENWHLSMTCLKSVDKKVNIHWDEMLRLYF